MITGRTRLLAVFADPIEHVQAPRLINALLESRGHDAVLVPVHVSAEGLADAVRGLRVLRNCAGGVVTMPHKASFFGLVDDVSDDARRIGAVNVFQRAADGRLSGDNMDGAGFIDGLASEGHAVEGKRVYLAGAGGAAAAIAFAVAAHGAVSLAVHNRTTAAAANLAARVRDAFPRLPVAVADRGPEASSHDVVVNTTPLGRAPNDELPFDVGGLGPGVLCADILMGVETRLLREATARGCAIHRGEAMLAAQIERMVRWWFGEAPSG